MPLFCLIPKRRSWQFSLSVLLLSFYAEEILLVGKAREHCCNFHVRGINYAGAMAHCSKSFGSILWICSSISSCLLPSSKKWLGKKKEDDIKEKVRIKKYEIIKGSSPHRPSTHAFSLAGQYGETSTGNSKFEIYGTGLGFFLSEGTE